MAVPEALHRLRNARMRPSPGALVLHRNGNAAVAPAIPREPGQALFPIVPRRNSYKRDMNVTVRGRTSDTRAP